VDDLGKSKRDALIVAVGYKVKAVWKAAPKIVYSLKDNDLFFVNREKESEQLNQIHKSKYNRASRGRGSDWVIPSQTMYGDWENPLLLVIILQSLENNGKTVLRRGLWMIFKKLFVLVTRLIYVSQRAP
jgi:hypothetical protein